MIRLTILLAVTLVVNARADYKSFQYQKMVEAGLQTLEDAGVLEWVGTTPHPRESIEEGVFDQRLDHNGCCGLELFKQRYYYDSTLAKSKDSPVFFYLCGEATCEPRSLQGAIREHAAKFGAHLIALEHRYYGKSQPFPKLTREKLKYLSTEFALKDAGTFITFAKDKYGLTGKWITFGGSYPGSLSAYFRSRLPHLAVGAIASSAPVRAEANFEEYDLHVSKVAGDACSARMREAVKEISRYVGKPEMAEMKKLFAAEGVKDDVDFLYIVADVGAAAIQYGFDKEFCKALDVPDVVKGYSDFAKVVYQKFQMSADRMSMYEGAVNEDPDHYLEGFGMRQWLYQSCNEYGYWQTAYHDTSLSVRSSLIDMDYHNRLCDRVFGITTPVDTSRINKYFYEPLFTESTKRILMTNGSQDPWSRLSIEQAVGKSDLKLYQIQGAAHCDDLRKSKPTDSAALKGARTLADSLIEEWLK